MGVKFEVKNEAKPREIEFPCILEWKGSGKNVIVLFHDMDHGTLIANPSSHATIGTYDTWTPANHKDWHLAGPVTLSNE